MKPARLTGLLFVLPALLLVGAFFLLPLGLTFWMSLHSWPLLGHGRFIGLQNYVSAFADGAFWHDVWFTVQYTLIVTVVLFGLALPLTLFVARPRPGIGLLRTAYFLPAVIGLPSASLIWVWLLNDESGLLTPLANRLGLTSSPLAVLTGANLTLVAIVAMVAWKMTGYTMMLLLPGLQAIPVEVSEAATMDGARPWAAFRWVTAPMMRRTIAMALLVSVTGSMLAFDQFYIINNGGPQDETMTAVYRIFDTSFVSFRVGYGSALSVILLMMLVVINLLQVRLLRGRDA